MSASPNSGTAPLAVTLSAAGSSDPDSGDSIASYTFNFGDGSAAVTQTGAMVQHTYTAAGNYTASVVATDTHQANSAAASTTITVTAAAPSNTAPVAQLTATPTSGTAPLDVTLDASGSSDADAGDKVASYTFTFGDGSPAVTQAAATAKHTYTAAGSYSPSVVVTDTHNANSTAASASVMVSAAPVNQAPTAVLKADRVSGTVPLTVNFDGSASKDPDSGDAVARYDFDFGDGSAVVSQATATVQHVYTRIGTFTATLKVYDTHASSGASSTLVIAVSAAPVAQPVAESSRLGGGAFPAAGLLLFGLGALVRRRRSAPAA